MANRKCEHEVYGSVCLSCGALGVAGVGPSNDDPVAVQVEMRAAEIAGSNRSDDGWLRGEDESSGCCDHFTGADRAPGEDYKSWNSGWLSSEIRHHDTRREVRDATAWAWFIDRPLAEQDIDGQVKAFLDLALQPSPFQPPPDDAAAEFSAALTAANAALERAESAVKAMVESLTELAAVAEVDGYDPQATHERFDTTEEEG